jgi:hypothetical protein
MSDLKVCCLCATRGRNFYLSRSLAFFLDQDYPDKHLLIYNNAEISQKLDSSIDLNMVTLINNSIDSRTGLPYKTLGCIYNDMLKYIPNDVNVLNMYDDDDLRMSYFLSEGIKGYKRALGQGKLAYKPKTSLMRSSDKISTIENVLEPSIFVNNDHVLKHGFIESKTTGTHFGWITPLDRYNKILVDNLNSPNFVYGWGEEVPNHHASGDDNIENYRNFSIDYPIDGIIRRLPKENTEIYYKEIENFLAKNKDNTTIKAGMILQLSESWNNVLHQYMVRFVNSN